MNRNNFTVTLWGFVAFLILLCHLQLSAQNGDTVFTAGQDAPKFFLRDMKNNDYYSSDFFGEPRKTLNAPKDRYPVVISFFATWCKPCRREITELELLQKKYPSVKFFLINLAESEETVNEYLKTMPIQLTILMDKFGKTAEKFKVQKPGTKIAVLPTLVMIRPDGKVHFYKKGYEEGDEKKIESEIIRLMQN